MSWSDKDDDSFWVIFWESYPGQVIQVFALFFGLLTVMLVILGVLFVTATTAVDARRNAQTHQEPAPQVVALPHVEPVPCSTPSALELAHCGGKRCPSSECTNGR